MISCLESPHPFPTATMKKQTTNTTHTTAKANKQTKSQKGDKNKTTNKKSQQLKLSQSTVSLLDSYTVNSVYRSLCSPTCNSSQEILPHVYITLYNSLYKKESYSSFTTRTKKLEKQNTCHIKIKSINRGLELELLVLRQPAVSLCSFLLRFLMFKLIFT